MTTDAARRQLDEQGYVLLEGFMLSTGERLLGELRRRILDILEEEGDRAGHEFKTEATARRLANLVDKGEVFRRAIVLPELLDCVRHVLGPRIKLSSLNARSADPHSSEGQPLHVDMGAVPDGEGYWVCNTVWLRRAWFRAPTNGARALRTSSTIRWRHIPTKCCCSAALAMSQS